MIDFSSIHSAIKSKIEASGFSYQSIDKWPNLNRDFFPATWRGQGFSMFLELGAAEDEYADANSGELKIRIEFALDAVNDRYLSQIPTMVTAVKAVRDSIETTLRGTQATIPNLDNWCTFYLDNFEKHVIAIFDQIKIEIAIS